MLSYPLLGIDEAGRGCCLGDMILCGVMTLKSPTYPQGIKDSKQLSPKKRTEIDNFIRNSDNFIVFIESADPEMIDNFINSPNQSLNSLERLMAQWIIRDAVSKLDQLGIGGLSLTTIIDGEDIFSGLITHRPDIWQSDSDIVENIFAYPKADSIYPIVSAASICAKVERDKRIEKLMGKWPGGGYCNECTKEWLDNYYYHYGEYPLKQMRMSFSWTEKLMKEKK